MEEILSGRSGANSRVTRAEIVSGQAYQSILFGPDPFKRERVSLGFPSAPAASEGSPYLQIASRASLSQALEIGLQARDLVSGSTVVLAKTGWFAVALLPSAQNLAALQHLKDSGRIPRDSLLVSGNLYDEVIWRSTERPDPRLGSYFPESLYKTARDALAAGQGLAALRMLSSELTKSGRTDYVLGAKINFDGLGGVSRNDANGMSWLLRGENDGDLRSIEMLAAVYFDGAVVSRDVARAIGYLQNAAARGSTFAQVELGRRYIKGEGLPQDYEEAVRLFKAAAIGGDAEAQTHLGTAYQVGFMNKKNPKQAYFWFNIAAARLPPGKAHDDASNRRDEIAKQLSGSDLLEVQRASRDWQTGTTPPEFPSESVVAQKPPAATNLPKGETPSAPSERAGETKGNPKPDSSGTGFVVTKEGLAITNAHVAGGCAAISVSVPGSDPVKATVVALDRANDLALLRTGLTTTTVPEFRNFIRLGERVGTFGFPLAGLISSTGNFTTGDITATSGMRDDTRFIQISAPIQPGNSGGPLVDAFGNVAGVVVAKINAMMVIDKINDVPQNINFAIAPTALRGFLEANGVRVTVAEEGRKREPLQPAELADRAKRMSIYVQCLR